MRKIICFLSAIGLVCSIVSCKKDFLDVNTNPNSPTSASPELVLPAALNATAARQITRNLLLKKVGDKYFVTSTPVKELSIINDKRVVLENVAASNFDLTKKAGKLQGPVRISFNADKIETFSVVLSNEPGEKMVVGYNKEGNYFYADRSASGKIEFEKEFGSFHYAPRLTGVDSCNVTLIIDESSVEVFADNGLTVMTEIFFPSQPYSQIRIESPGNMSLKRLEYTALKSIWP